MKVLICGDRYWGRNWARKDAELMPNRHDLDVEQLKMLKLVVDGLKPGTVVFHGAAKGADLKAGTFAEIAGLPVRRFPADWATHGKAAGPIRNREMLGAKPDYVFAFHENLKESKGTADMVKIARKAGVPVLHYTSKGLAAGTPFGWYDADNQLWFPLDTP